MKIAFLSWTTAVIAACAAAPSSSPVAIQSPPTSVQSAPESAVCAALKTEAATKRFFRDFLGDALVLKRALDFPDHASIEELGRASGAAEVEPFVVDAAWVESSFGARAVVLDGVENLERFKPYVIAGALDKLTVDQVALAEPIARALGSRLGTRLDLYRSTGSTLHGESGERRVVEVASILRFPGEALHHYGDRYVLMSLAGARAFHADNPEADTTGVRFWVPPNSNKVLDRLAEEIAPKELFRFLRLQEVTGAGYDDALADTKAFCGTRDRSLDDPSEPKKTLTACALGPQIEKDRAVITEFFGDILILGDDTSKILEGAKTAGVRAEPSLSFSAGVVTAAGFRSVQVEAIDARIVDVLSRYPRVGDLQASVNGDGIVVGIGLADRLRMTVGDSVYVRLKPSRKRTDAVGWNTKIAAVVSFPPGTLDEIDQDHVWLSSNETRTRGRLKPDTFNAAIVWTKSPAETDSFIQAIVHSLDSTDSFGKNMERATLDQALPVLKSFCYEQRVKP